MRKKEESEQVNEEEDMLALKHTQSAPSMTKNRYPIKNLSNIDIEENEENGEEDDDDHDEREIMIEREMLNGRKRGSSGVSQIPSSSSNQQRRRLRHIKRNNNSTITTNNLKSSSAASEPDPSERRPDEEEEDTECSFFNHVQTALV